VDVRSQENHRVPTETRRLSDTTTFWEASSQHNSISSSALSVNLMADNTMTVAPAKGAAIRPKFEALPMVQKS